MDQPRQGILEAAYACVARKGIAKTTIEDAAREAQVSRATVYRTFPGGRQELINAVVAWATLEFFARLYEQVQGAANLEEVMERGIMFAHRSIVEHEVLQRVMQTEPEKLLPALTFESIRIRDGIAEFLVPYLEQRGWPTGSISRRRPTSSPAWCCPTCRHPAGGTSTTPTRWRSWCGPSSWPGWWRAPSRRNGVDNETKFRPNVPARGGTGGRTSCGGRRGRGGRHRLGTGRERPRQVGI